MNIFKRDMMQEFNLEKKKDSDPVVKSLELPKGHHWIFLSI